ncbi:MAG: paraquat-inducible protein A [Gammaproteobacteria bacterium]
MRGLHTHSCSEHDNGAGQTPLTACHDCDGLYRTTTGANRAHRAACPRCGSTLYRVLPNALDRALALQLTVLMLLAIVNLSPFLALELGGRVEQTHLISGAWALTRLGQWELGLIVALTSVVFPLLTAMGWLYLLIPLKFGIRPRHLGRVYRWTRSLAPWSMISVFMLGVIVAAVKLLEMANVIPGVGLFALIALLIVSSAARAYEAPEIIWPAEQSTAPMLPAVPAPTALGNGLFRCHDCGHLSPADTDHCPRCGGHLHARKPASTTRAWALLSAAAVLFLPANLYPVMTVVQFGAEQTSTILGGIILLIKAGMVPLAIVVLFASIIVPLLKLIALAYLLLSVRRRSRWRPRDRTRLYRVAEAVGAWSMVDIYLVAILSALVSLDALATIEAGLGASFFAAVVVLTMFAAHSFDPRLIWDHATKS